jgi:N-acetylneuraminate synthase/N,N'-diacetyllegionaminate synthase
MKTLKTATNLSVGYSDHTEGLKAIEIAVSMGAQVIEFHFTDSRDGKVFRDHKVSLTPSEVKDLQTRLKEIYNLQGEFSKVPQKIELDNDHVTSFRRGIYLNKDLNKGDEIKLEDLICLRPNHGIDARDFNLIVGSKTLKSIKKFTKIIIGRDI